MNSFEILAFLMTAQLMVVVGAIAYLHICLGNRLSSIEAMIKEMKK